MADSLNSGVLADPRPALSAAEQIQILGQPGLDFRQRQIEVARHIYLG